MIYPKFINPEEIDERNKYTGGGYFCSERKPTELEKKIQKIIDRLYNGINYDKIEHNWRLNYIKQLQNVIYQIQINDVNPIWERKEKKKKMKFNSKTN